MLSRFNNPSETLKANEAKSNWGRRRLAYKSQAIDAIVVLGRYPRVSDEERICMITICLTRAIGAIGIWIV